MKYCAVVVLAVSLAASPALVAGEVVRAEDDNTFGGAFGGATGLLVGGALAGGIPGALIGGLLGVLGGKGLQQHAGLSQQAYVVETADGQRQRLRSPTETYQPGEQVVLVEGRIRKAEEASVRQ